MANYQNNMRYGRQGSMYQQRQSRSGNYGPGQRRMPGMDSRYSTSGSKQECGCNPARSEQERECGRENVRTDRECGRENVRTDRERGRENVRTDRECGCENVRMERECGCDCSRSGSGQEREHDSAGMEKKSQKQGSCGCHRDDELAGMALAMAYVPWQSWRKVYDVCKALQIGTIFGELDKPFLGRGGCNR